MAYHRLHFRKRSLCAGCGRVLRVDGALFCRRCRQADARLPADLPRWCPVCGSRVTGDACAGCATCPVAQKSGAAE
jgi:hypothetical protein